VFVDSRTLNRDGDISCDLCIVGGGPAGISLAREFTGLDIQVCLLESGDITYDEATGCLADGEYLGDQFEPLRDMRHRQFGGMSNLWNVTLHQERIGVRYADLDEIDFEKREWVPYSGWPITKKELVPYYKRAHTFCQLGDYNYSTEPWETERTPRIMTTGGKICSSMFKFGPSDIYTKEYKAELEKSVNIAVYTNANVVEVETDETARSATRVKAVCLTGKSFFVKAKTFVLAAGCLENSRILLLSRRVQKEGLGNQNDLVGRYFMDHPLIYRDTIILKDKRTVHRLGLYDKRRVKNETIMAKFQLTAETMRDNKLLHMAAMIFPRDRHYQSEAKNSFRTLVSAVRQFRLPENAPQHMKKILFNSYDLMSEFYKHRIRHERVIPNLERGEWSTGNAADFTKFEKLEIITQTEQSPHPDNRVTLSNSLDKLGYRRVKLTNRWNDLDKKSIRKAQAIFADEFKVLGTMVEPLLKPDQLVLSAHHNMGTTRMSQDPKQGVVDRDCKVHGIANLFIAGSSIFPTGGFANPTLTIIAFSIRLADHLKRVIKTVEIAVNKSPTDVTLRNDW
jgi:choline dehydrogenase-like flavoprotein